MKKSHIASALLAALVLVAAGGCAISKADAQHTGDGYFAAVKNEDYDAAATLCNATFFQNMPRDEWIREQKAIVTKLGDLVSWKLVSWNVTNYVGSFTGTKYELRYDTTWTNGPATINMSLVKPHGTKMPSISGYQVNSAVFLK